MTRFADELELGKYGSHIIAYNGAEILEVSNRKTIFEQPLTKEDLHQLFDFSVRHKVHMLTYIDDVIISQTDSEYIDKEQQITGMPYRKVPNFKEAVYKSAIKCLMLEEPTYLRSVLEILAKEMPHKSVTTSKPFFLEVMQHGIDKAASLQRLATQLGITQHEIIAVGNALNDLSMVEYAGLGIWVENVTQELRGKADFIVASNNNDGVAEVVERFILVD
jgi:Cof subfamily protein (haloacid dehalogenase superfamily)